MTVIELLKIFLVSQIEKLGSSIDWGKFKEAFEEDAEKKLGTEFDVDKRLQVYNFIDEFAANFEAKGGFAYLGTDMLAEVIEDSLGTGDACKLGSELRTKLAAIQPVAKPVDMDKKLKKEI